MRLKNFSLSLGNQIFKSFSDESRVRIMYLLFQNQEMCISDLELVLDFTQTKTSRHLIYLKNAGLVTLRKYDQWAFYAIKEEISDIVGQLFKYLEKDPTLLKDMDMFHQLSHNKELAIYKINLRNEKK